jgi:hypothetical protein
VIISVKRDLGEANASSAVDSSTVMATEGPVRNSPSLECNLNHFHPFTNLTPYLHCNIRLIDLCYVLFTDRLRRYT